MTSGTNEAGQPYVLGHSERELERLRNQARFLEPVTRGFLRDAGITRGMRVLDVGSGTGAVAFLAAELVGETGEVIGTDTAATAVAEATRAARSRSLTHVRFLEGNPAEMAFDGAFQAVVGRYVLPFQADPAAMLRGLARHLVEGGLLVFHEPDFGGVRSLPPVPLYDRACRWIIDTSRASGQSWSFLDKVSSAFARAQLPAPTLRMQTFVARAPHAREWLMAVGHMVESLLPAMERLEVATAEEVDLPTLRDRLWEEVRAADGLVVGRTELGIWTHVG
jgi:ubiquinone/menaquinone biosynthesis C-methylase UbiE